MICRGEAVSLAIGSFCSIADEVTILLGANHPLEAATTYPVALLLGGSQADDRTLARPKASDVVIGNDVWIGLGATIMAGARIGDGAVIAARSMVTKDVEPYWIVGGNPARALRPRLPPDLAMRLQALGWWNWPDDVIRSATPLLTSRLTPEVLASLEEIAPKD